MNIEENTHEQFDRYIRGLMGDAERKEFSLQLDNDPELKKAFELHTNIVAGLRESRRQELKAYITKNAKISVLGTTRNKFWLIATAAAIAVFAVSYMAIQFMTNNNAETTSVAKNADSAQVAANETKNDTSISLPKEDSDEGLEDNTNKNEEVPAIHQDDNKNLTLDNNEGQNPSPKDYIANYKAPVFTITGVETDKNKVAAPTSTSRKVEVILSKGEKNTYKYNKAQLVLYTDNTDGNTLSKVAIYEMSTKSYLGYEKAYYPLIPDGRVNNLVKLTDAAILKKLPILK